MKNFRNITASELYGAIVNFGSDPYIIENEEQALSILESINNSEMRMIRDSLEYESAKAALDLTHHVTNEIYSGVDGSEFIICLAEDWI